MAIPREGQKTRAEQLLPVRPRNIDSKRRILERSTRNSRHRVRPLSPEIPCNCLPEKRMRREDIIESSMFG